MTARYEIAAYIEEAKISGRKDYNTCHETKKVLNLMNLVQKEADLPCTQVNVDV